MFTFDISDVLRKKLVKIGKRDKVLAEIFNKKITEVINRDENTINAYKNLKAPQNEFKRIHLTSNYVLLFKVDMRNNNIVFVDILHWDYAYY